MEAVEPQNKYINLVDICGNDVSILDTDVNYEYDMDYDFDTKRYIIYHTTDTNGNLYYSVEQTDYMTINWIHEIYDVKTIKYNNINFSIATDTEYRIYNKNKLVDSIFNVECAGNVLFWIEDEYLNEIECKNVIKSIKNDAVRTGMVDYRNIRI